MTPPESAQPFIEKHREISAATIALQSALQQALDEIFPTEKSARSIARRLLIDKTLGWQTLRIATSPDPATILAALPGERGFQSLIAALEQQGVSAESIEPLRRASETLWRIFERFGSSPREILAIAAGGLDSQAQRRTLDRMLKVHFESAVAIRGEVAAAQVDTWIVTPSRENPSLATLVALPMLNGLRTIRPLGPRIVFRGASAAANALASEWSSVDAGARGPMPLVVPEASSPELDRCGLEFKTSPRGPFILADPDRHPAGSVTLGFADMLEGVGSIHRTEQDRTAELTTQLALPVRHFYFDVLFDESIPAVEPTAALYFSAAQGIEHGEFAELRRFTGEIEGRFVRSPALPKSSGVDAERHRALLQHGARLVDRPLEAFRCFRMHIAYPPSYSRAVVRWLLPERGKR